jgi:lysozyme
MMTSEAGLRFLEQNEGRILRVYKDASGILTCGVGHVVRPEDHLAFGESISEELCEMFLREDVGKAEDAISAAVEVELTQNQFDALVSLTFNIGVHGFQHSSVLRDVNSGNLSDEKRAFELWDKDMKHGQLVVDPALLERRDREVALFFTPDAES